VLVKCVAYGVWSSRTDFTENVFDSLAAGSCVSAGGDVDRVSWVISSSRTVSRETKVSSQPSRLSKCRFWNCSPTSSASGFCGRLSSGLKRSRLHSEGRELTALSRRVLRHCGKLTTDAEYSGQLREAGYTRHSASTLIWPIFTIASICIPAEFIQWFVIQEVLKIGTHVPGGNL